MRSWWGAGPAQLSPASQRDIPYTIECHGQYINWRQLASRIAAWGWMGRQSAVGDQVCCASCFSWVLSLSLLSNTSIIIIF